MRRFLLPPDTDDTRISAEYRFSVTELYPGCMMGLSEGEEVRKVIFRLLIDKDKPEEITATVHERTALIDEIEELVLRDCVTDQVPGYAEDEILMLNIAQVECFLVEGERTYAVYSDGKRYLVRRRLYELEETLPENFERIGKSALANWKMIAKFKVQLSGAVDAVFRSGHVECISRRCFAELKRRYGL